MTNGSDDVSETPAESAHGQDAATFDTTPGDAQWGGGVVEVLIGQALWASWFEIALERRDAALDARASAVASRANDVDVAEDLKREFTAALVAVSAAAHALDALYGQLATAEVKADGPGDGARREARVRECIKRRFNTGPQNGRWATEFRWLFGLRDAAVHARFEMLPTVEHPSGLTHVGQLSADYTAEASARAIDLVAEVLDVCANNPRQTDAGAMQWSADYRLAIDTILSGLREQRAPGSSDTPDPYRN